MAAAWVVARWAERGGAPPEHGAVWHARPPLALLLLQLSARGVRPRRTEEEDAGALASADLVLTPFSVVAADEARRASGGPGLFGLRWRRAPRPTPRPAAV
jgi:hypothetical protein